MTEPKGSMKREYRCTKCDKVYEAALKVVEALDVDASTIKVPVQIAFALVNLQRAVNGATQLPEPAPVPQLEEKFADTLARKCDELETENKMLRERIEEQDKILEEEFGG